MGRDSVGRGVIVACGFVGLVACNAFFDSDGLTGGAGAPDASTSDSGLTSFTDASADGGDAASAAPITSCVGLARTCGPNSNADCCASNRVPGGTYNRGNDTSYPATVSPFELDVYLVTVGRFRAFVNAGKGTQASPPDSGAGAAATTPPDSWLGSDRTNLPADTDALKAALKCDDAIQTWTDTPDQNEAKPINCVSWFESYAFCIWDGGRLPTEAEWNLASAGGTEQRDYPWGSTPPDSLHARYSIDRTIEVGSFSPNGDAKWGHADMAGNVWEWTLDWSHENYGFKVCNDCVDLQVGNDRVIRGGSFQDSAEFLGTGYRGSGDPTSHARNYGVRCARAVNP